MDDWVTVKNPATGDMFADKAYVWNNGQASYVDPDSGNTLANPYFGFDFIAEGTPQHDDDVIVNGVWDNTPGKRALKLEEVKNEQAIRFAMGWSHTFSVGNHVLDLRDADDKANWTLLLIKTQSMNPTDTVRIKTAMNDEIVIPAGEALLAMIDFLAWGQAMLTHKWDLDNQIKASDDPDSIDVTAGWP